MLVIILLVEHCDCEERPGEFGRLPPLARRPLCDKFAGRSAFLKVVSTRNFAGLCAVFLLFFFPSPMCTREWAVFVCRAQRVSIFMGNILSRTLCEEKIDCPETFSKQEEETGWSKMCQSFFTARLDPT